MGLKVLTVTLDGVVCDTTQHGELRVFSAAETLPHPREEVGQAIMSSLDALGDTRTSTRERERSNAVGTERDVWVGIGEMQLGLQDIF